MCGAGRGWTFSLIRSYMWPSTGSILDFSASCTFARSYGWSFQFMQRGLCLLSRLLWRKQDRANRLVPDFIKSTAVMNIKATTWASTSVQFSTSWASTWPLVKLYVLRRLCNHCRVTTLIWDLNIFLSYGGTVFGCAAYDYVVRIHGFLAQNLGKVKHAFPRRYNNKLSTAPPEVPTHRKGPSKASLVHIGAIP